MNKLISLKDQDNNLINKQCVGIDTTNVLVNGSLTSTGYTATQDCMACPNNYNQSWNSPAIYIDGQLIGYCCSTNAVWGSLNIPMKKGQKITCDGTYNFIVYGLKYL